MKFLFVIGGYGRTAGRLVFPFVMALTWISSGVSGSAHADITDGVSLEAGDNGLGFSAALSGRMGLSEHMSVGVGIENAVAAFTHRVGEDLFGSGNTTGFDLHERLDITSVDLFVGLRRVSESRLQFLNSCDLGISRYAIHHSMMIWDPAHPPAFHGTADFSGYSPYVAVQLVTWSIRSDRKTTLALVAKSRLATLPNPTLLYADNGNGRWWIFEESEKGGRNLHFPYPEAAIRLDRAF